MSTADMCRGMWQHLPMCHSPAQLHEGRDARINECPPAELTVKVSHPACRREDARSCMGVILPVTHLSGSMCLGLVLPRAAGSSKVCRPCFGPNQLCPASRRLKSFCFLHPNKTSGAVAVLALSIENCGRLLQSKLPPSKGTQDYCGQLLMAVQAFKIFDCAICIEK